LQAYIDGKELHPVSVPTDSFFGERRCMMMFLLLMILLTYIALMSPPSLVGEKFLPPTTGTPLARHASEFSRSGEDANINRRAR
jgi:hypothetical protein